jgi:glycosyltransferase involved in cell wall biosynthesis
MSFGPERPEAAPVPGACAGRRPRIAFFDYPDVFEDFYPHYGVDQRSFATRFAGTLNHAILALIQREVGDVTWFSFSLAPELEEARHEVVGCRVRMLRSPLPHRLLWRAFYLPRSSWRWRRAYPLYAPLASYASLASPRLLRELTRAKFDFLFVQDYATGRFDVLAAAARWLRIPLVAYHSGSRPEWYQGRLVKRATLRSAHRLLASSEAERRQLVEDFGVAPARVDVFLGCVDTGAFRPLSRAEAARASGLDPARRHLLFVGRLDDRVKRVSALIRCFGALAPHWPDVDLVIAGDGPDRAALSRLALDAAPAERIRFTGWVEGVDARARLYNAAECLLLPSRSEGSPAVVGEAAACGTPSIASRVGGISELVAEGETGWLLEPGDDAGLRERLNFALASPRVLAAMRPAARRRAEALLAPEVAAAILRRCFARAKAPAGAPCC